MRDFKKTWRKKSREYLAIAFGGKCTICGYDKTIAALDYHHLDPEDKDELLSIAMRDGYAWHKIVEEARKCTILCCRCHREVHAGVTQVPENCVRFNEEYSEIIKLKQKEFDSCLVCGKEKNKRYKYCSSKCSQIDSRKFNIERSELESLINEKPYEVIGKMYGVTGSAVKKRCKSLGIKTENRRGYWSRRV